MCSIYKWFNSPFDHHTPNPLQQDRLCLYMHANIEVTDRKFYLFLNTSTVSFILPAGCKITRCEYESVHLRTNRLRFKWNAFGCSRTSNFRCDGCSKCSSLYPFQPTYKYFQHQGIFSTSHWWTAPIHMFWLYCQSKNSGTTQFKLKNSLFWYSSG